tara:strand:+ start:3436 stop:4182 length:747 start_codon:yes stop_codon:yes gene_type:complete
MNTIRLKYYTAGQYVYFFLRDTSSYQQGETGQSSYLAAYLYKDGSTSYETTASVEEVSSSYAPGLYQVELSALNTTCESGAIFLLNGYYPSIQAYPVFFRTDYGDGIMDVNALTADVTKISGDTTSAGNLEAFFDGTGYGIQPAAGATEVAADLSKIDGSTDGVSSLSKGSNSILQGSVTTGSTTSSIKGTGALSTTDDFYNDRMLLFTSGDLQYQGKPITDYVGSSKTFTTDPFTSAPASSDTFIIV